MATLKEQLIQQALAPIKQQAEKAQQDVQTLAGGDVAKAKDVPALIEQAKQQVRDEFTKGLASKLSKAGDTATGPIMVPKAIDDAAATRLEQTYGGLNSPIRYATAVGTTAVAMQPGPLTDPTPQKRKAKPYLVILTMRSAPVALAATITVGTTPGGAEVFSKTYALAGLPVLNNLLAPLQPVFIELPANTTLYAKATSGTWDVEVLSYYKS